MSLFIYAGSLQYVGVGLLSGGASLLTTAVTSLAVNARHLFYSISMLDVYREMPLLRRIYSIFALTDETYSVVVAGIPKSEEDPGLFRFLLSLFHQSYWVFGSVLGAVLGKSLPFPTTGIEFSMTALFAASFVEQWKSSKNHLPALTGLAATALCLLVFGRKNFLIPSMLIMTAVLTLFRRQLTEEENA